MSYDAAVPKLLNNAAGKGERSTPQCYFGRTTPHFTSSSKRTQLTIQKQEHVTDVARLQRTDMRVHFHTIRGSKPDSVKNR